MVKTSELPQRISQDFGEISVEAFATGRKEARGGMTVRIWNDDGMAKSYISTSQAREIGKFLLDAAEQADQFSTRGFVGSDE